MCHFIRLGNAQGYRKRTLGFEKLGAESPATGAVRKESRITFIGYAINLTSREILLIHSTTSELKYALLWGL